MSSSTVPFSLDKPSKYDLTTYWGRVRHFFDIFDPANLMYSEKDIASSQQLLQAFKEGSLPASTSHDQLWHAKKVVEASLHPDTNQPVPLPFRMSAFVPVNVPIVVGMLSAPNTIGATAFWQWVNQSYNVAVNYANRNASNSMTTTQIAGAYAGATLTSCSVAIGLGQLVKRATGLSPALSTVVGKVVPFTAVATAGALNVLMMRYNEGLEGIEVRDEQGNLVGRSTAAGQKALTEVVATRVALPVPVLLFPPLINGALSRLNLMPSHPRLRMVAEIAVTTGCLWGALPFAIGLFPQVGQIQASQLEPELRKKLTPAQSNATFFYNKGL